MIEQIVIFFQIVFIDLVLAGDNAIIIGMVASQFKDEVRKKIIFWGIGAAIILRIIFTLITAYLLQINGLKTIGGLLLLYIAYKLYKDVIKEEVNDEKKIKTDGSNLFKILETESRSFCVLLIIIRLAPASARAIAHALPIPFPAPVTKAILFFKLIFLRYIILYKYF